MKEPIVLDTVKIFNEELTDLVRKNAVKEGTTETNIPFLGFIKSSTPSEIRHGILSPSICLIIQGAKGLLIGKDIFHYGVGNYVVSAIDMPTSGQIRKATAARPYLGVRVDLDPKEIATLVIATKMVPAQKKSGPGAFAEKSDIELQDAIFRLVKLLDKTPQDIAILAPLIRQEIMYRLLSSPNGHLLFKAAVADKDELGIGRAVQWLKKNYARSLKMEDLAKEMNMSLSALHHKFKSVTTMAPLQYQKQLRLLEARRLLLTGNIDAATASYKVGYESPSQFSREYRRLFGESPAKDAQALKKNEMNSF